MHTEATNSLNTSKEYKASILSRLNSNNTSQSKSKCPSSTQCETGLFASKFSLNENENSISEFYASYQKGIKVNVVKLLNSVKGYFEDFQDNFLKLKVMVDNFKFTNKSEPEEIDNFRQLSDILTLFKVPIVYKKNP